MARSHQGEAGTAQRPPRQNLRKAVPLLVVGAGLMTAIVLALGGRGVIERLASTKLSYFLAALGVQMAYMVLWSLRWGLIIGAQGQRIPREIIAITFAGDLFNNVTPVANTGGEPVRAYLLGKANRTSFEEGMSSVVVDRIFDMLPFVVICLATMILVSAFHLAEDVLLRTLTLLGLFCSAAICAGIVYATLRKEAGYRIVAFIVDKLGVLIRRFRPIEGLKSHAMQALERFYAGIDTILEKKRVLALSLGISFILWVLAISRTKLVFLSLGASPSLLIVNVVAVASIFSGFIPLLPGGLGAIETTMIVLYVGLGLNRDLAGSAVLLDRIISYWLMSLVGAATSTYLGLQLGGSNTDPSQRKGPG